MSESKATCDICGAEAGGGEHLHYAYGVGETKVAKTYDRTVTTLSVRMLGKAEGLVCRACRRAILRKRLAENRRRFRGKLVRDAILPVAIVGALVGGRFLPAGLLGGTVLSTVYVALILAGIPLGIYCLVDGRAKRRLGFKTALHREHNAKLLGQRLRPLALRPFRDKGRLDAYVISESNLGEWLYADEEEA